MGETEITDAIYPDILSKMKDELHDFMKKEDEILKDSVTTSNSQNYAYNEDVKNGFKGTLEDWVKNMRGYKGDPGDTVYVGDRVPSSRSHFWFDTSMVPAVADFVLTSENVGEIMVEVDEKIYPIENASLNGKVTTVGSYDFTIK